jgi:Domain of unknown function (DUF4167)
MRGRNPNRSKGPNPLTRSYESNGPDVKIRGTAQHIADKYAQLARDAQSSGDPVAAENYHQHAEHYYRIIAAAQEQFREQFGSGYQRPMDEDGDEDSPGYGQGERPMPQQGEDGDFASQPQPFEMRAEQGERQDRFDRGGQDRGDRGDRFQGRDRFGRGDRPDRGERQDRGDRFQGRDRFPRNDRPRQDFQRPDYQRPESGREEGRPESRQDQPRQDQPRQDQPRQDQPRFDRRDRRREEAEDIGANGLPAFLTTPVRTPIAVAEPEGDDGAPAPAANGAAAHGEGNGRPRRRRRPRFEGPEGTGEAGADFAPEGGDTPPAE